MKKKFTYLFLFIGIFEIFAQNIPDKGVPHLENYLPGDYGNHGKIWDICTAKNGIVYTASEDGLLEFDGENWNHFRGSKGFTRSLLVSSDSLIYTGSDRDFGVWKKTKFQKFQYTSLYPFTKDPNAISEEFWHIFSYKESILFVSMNNIYTYKNKKLRRIPAPSRISVSSQINGKIYLADEKFGIYEFDGSSITKIINYPDNIPLQVSAIYGDANSLYIATKDRGIFRYSSGQLSPFETEVSPYLKKYYAFSFVQISSGHLAFGTIFNGLYITDLNGKIIHHINKNKGLPNNTVLSLHYNKSGDLWMGMDYGVTSFNLSNKITYINDYKGEFGTGYAASLKNNIFYLGTNQGLYKANWDDLNNNRDNNNFSLINGSEGQVWSLQNIGGTIFCGHDKGLFTLEDNHLKPFYKERGIWVIKPYQKDYFLTGNYDGISVFKKDGATWRFFKKIDLILGSVTQIEYEKNNIIWINIPNYGVIRFALDKDFHPVKRLIIRDNSFKGLFPHLYKDAEGIKVITTRHQYIFDTSKNKFVLKENSNNPDIEGIISGVYRATDLSNSYKFYPVNNGFALEKQDLDKDISEFSSSLLIRKAQAFNNEKAIDLSDGDDFPYQSNNVRFKFILPNEDHIEYQYFLENYSEKWSSWNSKNNVSFLGLKEGSYTLLVKARAHQKYTKTIRFGFTIKAPWYRTYLSYFCYVVLISGLIYILRQHHINKLKKQKLLHLKQEQKSLLRLAERHNKQILLEKQKQLELSQNNLKEEIRSKTIELATKAKEDEDKSRLLQTINEKIIEAETNPNISKLRLGEMRRLLKNYLEIEDHTFEIQMDELHQEFFKAMKKSFPNLSIYDLRLCAYIRIGLTSKEMSEILQVLPSSINVSRSRLRKKINLLPEEDLYEFLNKFGQTFKE